MAIFPSLFPRLLVPSFILACTSYPSSTCRIDFSKTETCPISPYPKWLGVVVKVEKYGSVRCRVLNYSNDSLFLLLCCFSTFPIRRNDLECHHQDRVALFALGYIYGQGRSFPWPRGQPSLDWALGPAQTLTWASRFYTPPQ